MKIKQGDTVKIITGKDKGKEGKVTHSFPKLNRIVVEGVNIHKRHRKPKKSGQKGQIVQMPMPIDVSNAKIMCSGCAKPVRIAQKVIGSRKFRACKKCGAELE